MRRFAALCLLAFALPCLSAAPTNKRIKVPVVKFVTVTTLAHEDERAFILRTAKIANTYTSFDGHEVCARICRAPDGRMAATLITARSSVGCPITDECEAGFTPTKQTLHTHPDATPRRITESDVPFMVHRGDRSRARVGARFVSSPATHFSPMDYANGPGYLVASGQVWFQSGEGTERLFDKVPD